MLNVKSMITGALVWVAKTFFKLKSAATIIPVVVEIGFWAMAMAKRMKDAKDVKAFRDAHKHAVKTGETKNAEDLLNKRINPNYVGGLLSFPEDNTTTKTN